LESYRIQTGKFSLQAKIFISGSTNKQTHEMVGICSNNLRYNIL